MKADFHIHSTFSDGTLTPTEIVYQAAKLDLNAISITDHDSLDGVSEAIKLGIEKNVYVIPGTELSTFDGTQDIHILGYWLDIKNKWISDLLEERREERFNRIKQILYKLDKIGIKVELSDVEDAATNAAMTRLHVAKAMVNLGYGEQIEKVFNKYLERGKIGFVPQKSMSPVKAINTIKKAGGLPVMAHPGETDNTKKVINDLIQSGIMGLEIYYPTHEASFIEYLLSLSKRYNLIVTGGSDFHGEGSRHTCDLGDIYIPDKAIDNLLKWKIKEEK
jgi:hypothetical protein